MKINYIHEDVPPNCTSSIGCLHKWIHLDTKKNYENRDFNTRFTRIDNFYCEKCCEIKSKITEDCCRTEPDWY